MMLKDLPVEIMENIFLFDRTYRDKMDLCIEKIRKHPYEKILEWFGQTFLVSTSIHRFEKKNRIVVRMRRKLLVLTFQDKGDGFHYSIRIMDPSSGTWKDYESIPISTGPKSYHSSFSF